MNSPVIRALIIAVVFSIIAYFIAGSIEITPVTLAIIVFLSALIPSFISGASNETQQQSSEVKTLYVGNLPYRANEGAVRALFAEHGTVHSVRLMKDKNTGKRRGFGFVEMSANDTDNAVSKLNDSEFQQRTLKVREAKERPERPAE
jgi:RNA recognition motif-containing protein